NVHIAENVLIGTGTTIIQELSIGKNTIIGAGALVTKDIPQDCTAVGAPAKPIKFHQILSYRGYRNEFFLSKLWKANSRYYSIITCFIFISFVIINYRNTCLL